MPGVSDTRAPSTDDVTFEVAVLEEVVRSADDFWKRWLWERAPAHHELDGDRCRTLAARFGVDADHVRVEWTRWYATLTSWEYGFALTGLDLRDLARRQGGRSHRRCR